MYVKHLRSINFNIECYLWPLMKLLKEIYWTFGPNCGRYMWSRGVYKEVACEISIEITRANHLDFVTMGRSKFKCMESSTRRYSHK